MKNSFLKKIILFSMLLALLIFTTACSSSETTPQSSSGNSSSQPSGDSTTLYGSWIHVYGNNVYDFMPDGTFYFTDFINDDSLSGEYTYDGSTLVFEFDDGTVLFATTGSSNFNERDDNILLDDTLEMYYHNITRTTMPEDIKDDMLTGEWVDDIDGAFRFDGEGEYAYAGLGELFNGNYSFDGETLILDRGYDLAPLVAFYEDDYFHVVSTDKFYDRNNSGYPADAFTVAEAWLVGSWVNDAGDITYELDGAGNYTLTDPNGTTYGTYTFNGDVLVFTDDSGASELTYYYYSDQSFSIESLEQWFYNYDTTISEPTDLGASSGKHDFMGVWTASYGHLYYQFDGVGNYQITFYTGETELGTYDFDGEYLMLTDSSGNTVSTFVSFDQRFYDDTNFVNVFKWNDNLQGDWVHPDGNTFYRFDGNGNVQKHILTDTDGKITTGTYSLDGYELTIDDNSGTLFTASLDPTTLELIPNDGSIALLYVGVYI